MINEDGAFRAARSIITTLGGADTEMTSCPYWVVKERGQETEYGIWFCREDAEEWVKENHYNLESAYVYCKSGHRSEKYKALCKALDKH